MTDDAINIIIIIIIAYNYRQEQYMYMMSVYKSNRYVSASTHPH